MSQTEKTARFPGQVGPFDVVAGDTQETRSDAMTLTFPQLARFIYKWKMAFIPDPGLWTVVVTSVGSICTAAGVAWGKWLEHQRNLRALKARSDDEQRDDNAEARREEWGRHGFDRLVAFMESEIRQRDARIEKLEMKFEQFGIFQAQQTADQMRGIETVQARVQIVEEKTSALPPRHTTPMPPGTAE